MESPQHFDGGRRASGLGEDTTVDQEFDAREPR
jgi:hypothetical protein